MKKLITAGVIAGGLVLGTGGVASAHTLDVVTPDGTEVVGGHSLHPPGAAAHGTGLPIANCALDGNPSAANLNGPGDC